MLGVQQARADRACAGEFCSFCEQLMHDMRARPEPDPTDCSIGAQLLRIRDPATGCLTFHLTEKHTGSALGAGQQCTSPIGSDKVKGQG